MRTEPTFQLYQGFKKDKDPKTKKTIKTDMMKAKIIVNAINYLKITRIY